MSEGVQYIHWMQLAEKPLSRKFICTAVGGIAVVQHEWNVTSPSSKETLQRSNNITTDLRCDMLGIMTKSWKDGKDEQSSILKRDVKEVDISRRAKPTTQTEPHTPLHVGHVITFRLVYTVLKRQCCCARRCINSEFSPSLHRQALSHRRPQGERPSNGASKHVWKEAGWV
jgi:hypothetical protein